MPLEFTAISPQDRAQHVAVASIPLQAHDYIISQALANGYTQLSRMIEYWDDVVFEGDDLEILQLELFQIQKILIPAEQEARLLSELFRKMDFVLAKAQEIGGHVEAIAD